MGKRESVSITGPELVVPGGLKQICWRQKDTTHLCRAHHLLRLGPLRHLSHIVVIVGPAFWRLVLLPGRSRLRERRREAVHPAGAGDCALKRRSRGDSRDQSLGHASMSAGDGDGGVDAGLKLLSYQNFEPSLGAAMARDTHLSSVHGPPRRVLMQLTGFRITGAAAGPCSGLSGGWRESINAGA